MKKILLFISCLFTFELASAQVSVFVGGGMNTYSMGDMKDLQNEFANSFPVQPKVTTSFPAFWGYELSVLAKLKQSISVGGNIGYYSTGGRVDYSDYSGALRLDQINTTIALGVPVQFQLNKSENNVLSFELMPAVLLGSLDIKSMSRIGAQESSDVQSFSETNVSLQPSVIFNKRIWHFGLYLRAGYLAQVYNSRLYLKQDHHYYLLNSKGEEVHLDWSGMRLSAGVSFTFKK